MAGWPMHGLRAGGGQDPRWRPAEGRVVPGGWRPLWVSYSSLLGVLRVGRGIDGPRKAVLAHKRLHSRPPPPHTMPSSPLLRAGPTCLMFSATTHTDLEMRARSQGIPVCIIHNASIMNAVGACGLQLYRFGEAISIVFFTGE